MTGNRMSSKMKDVPGFGLGRRHRGASRLLTLAVRFLLMIVSVTPLLRGHQESKSDSTPVSGEVRARLASLLPKGGTADTRLTEGPLFYSAGNLYQYIDGAAEAFVGYRLVALVHAVYQKGNAEITVDVYDMGQADNAFGIYSAERSSEYSFITIGAEGYQAEGLINFLHDRFYVKLSAFIETQEDRGLLESFARYVSSAIGTTASLPKPLSLFPTDHLLPHTQTFVRRAPLGHEFLSPAYTAKYSFEPGTETTVVLSFAETADQARNRVRQLRAQVQKTGHCTPIQEPAEGFRGSTPYEGEILAFPKGKVAVILLNPPKTAETLIGELLTNLSSSGGE